MKLALELRQYATLIDFVVEFQRVCTDAMMTRPSVNEEWSLAIRAIDELHKKLKEANAAVYAPPSECFPQVCLAVTCP